MCYPSRKRSLRIETLLAFLDDLVARLAFSVRSRDRTDRLPPASAPLTLQQVVDYTFAHNPALLASRQNLLSMKGQEVEAGLRQNPNFLVYGSNLSNPATSVYSLRL